MNLGSRHSSDIHLFLLAYSAWVQQREGYVKLGGGGGEPKLAADMLGPSLKSRGGSSSGPAPAVVCEAPREMQLFPWPMCDLRIETSAPQLLPNFPTFAPMTHATGVLGPWSLVDVNVIHWGHQSLCPTPSLYSCL